MMTAGKRLILPFFIQTIRGSIAEAKTMEVKTTKTRSLTTKSKITRSIITTALKIVPEEMEIFISRSPSFIPVRNLLVNNLAQCEHRIGASRYGRSAAPPRGMWLFATRASRGDVNVNF